MQSWGMGAVVLGAIVVGYAGGAAAQDAQPPLPDINVTSTRLSDGGITGASTTVVTDEDIARSPSLTLQDILARQPGVQVQTLFGGVNGTNSTVDLRGFGATAPSNTLILINGGRLNDVDSVGIDLGAIPRESIARIEITRGNSGAVLYGDGAVGGVINIITKTGVSVKPTAHADGAVGSYGYREVNASAAGSFGPFSASAFTTVINSDGWRQNNALRQRSAVGDFRYTPSWGSIYFNISGDDQHLGLPGGRRVAPEINQLVTDPRGAATPFDYADKQGANASGGFAWQITPDAELIVDGGVRRKDQQGRFVEITFPDANRYVDTTLTTLSLTPRFNLNQSLFGLPTRSIFGVDVYSSDYDSARSVNPGNAPNHRYDLKQDVVAGYGQTTISVLPSTDIAAGLRVQNTSLSARDTLDRSAPGSFPEPQGIPLNSNDSQYAYHFGIEHRFNDSFAVFGRVARSFRVPNVDERIGMAPQFVDNPTTFALKTQTSHDVEGGVRVRFGSFTLQSSIYDMELNNEILFSPATFTNINLDPTRRRGFENIASWQVSDTVRLTGALTYTDARFREGDFAGHVVPLVSPWTANIGVTWDIWQKYLTFDGVVSYVGGRRMDNDQVNLQPLTSSYTTVDLRIGGQVDKFFWSFSVQNLFDVAYFDYAIASPYPFGFGSAIGTYNAYPQPGRTFLARAGVTF